MIRVATANQQRRSGGGRKRRDFEQPQLVEAMQRLVDASTRGDPMSPLRWTCKSTRTLADELSRVRVLGERQHRGTAAARMRL